jgi:putative transposase
MPELTNLLKALAPAIETNVQLLGEIIKGIYRISSGGVTMKNISRWTGKGGSYRSIQRFYSNPIDWLKLNIILFNFAHLPEKNLLRYVLALDETVEDKAGKQTFGINWFYSSLVGKVIRSISSHVVSIVDTHKEKSFALTHHQTVKAEVKSRRKTGKQKSGLKGKEKNKRGKAGRPKGSKNKSNTKNEGLLYTGFELLLSLVLPLLQAAGFTIRYVLGDGAYGNKTCCLIVRELGLELISKLNRNSALFLPYEGEYSGKGRRKKYGDKIDYQNIGEQYLESSKIDEGVKTKIYQIKGVWTRRMPFLLNVIIIEKTDLETQKMGRALLFSTDLSLEAFTILRFYSLRFQIEFNFRDAKQYFGLSDFKNIKEQQVKNAIGLSLFMTNLSAVLIQQAKQSWKEEKLSIQDLKAYFRAEKYLEDILNTLGIPKESILIQQTFQDVLKIGAINRTKSKALPS